MWIATFRKRDPLALEGAVAFADIVAGHLHHALAKLYERSMRDAHRHARFMPGGGVRPA